MDNVEGAVAALFPADAQASPEHDAPFCGGVEVSTSPPLPQQKEPQEEYGGESPLCSPRKDASKLRRVIRSGGMVGEGRAVLPVGADKKDEGGERRRRRRRKRKVVINSTFCKYDCVRKAAAEHEWLEDPNEDGEKGEFNVFWTDTSVAIFRVMRLQNWQRINHFPSMHTIARKVHLANTLAKMRKPFPQHFAFCPRTWSLKSERSAFKKFVQSLPQKRTFIVKPSAGCQGKGIFLTQDPQDIAEDIEEAVVQEYISRPLLIEDKKFDLRVYVLVTSMKSPSIFLFDEGLVRLCTVDYQKPTEDNAHDLMMHLTNYAINKASENFIFNEDADSGDVGHKRDFAFLNKWLTAQGHDVERVWSRIEKVVVKTLLAAQPILSHVYTSCFPHNNDGYTCFEVLGFDLLLDQSLKPWLLEVNHSPSFSCHTPLDERIKTGVIAEVVRILNLKVDDRQRERDREKDEFQRRMAAQARRAAVKKGGGDDTELKELESQEMEAERRRQDEFVKRKQQDEDSLLVNFRRIYPCQDPSRQVCFFAVADVLCCVGVRHFVSLLLVHTCSACTSNSSTAPKKSTRLHPPWPPSNARQSAAKSARSRESDRSAKRHCDAVCIGPNPPPRKQAEMHRTRTVVEMPAKAAAVAATRAGEAAEAATSNSGRHGEQRQRKMRSVQSSGR